MRQRIGVLLAFCALLGWARSAEVMPPKPVNYFNDYARVVSPSQAQAFNAQLQNFERSTSDQIVVAVFPKMETDSSIEDYTVRIAQAWGVGQKDRKNGAVLFVFIQDRKMFIQVGYGLEGPLTDALCWQIINNEIKPAFKTGDYAAGLQAGINAILAATKGEYKGTGKTVQDQKAQRKDEVSQAVGLMIFIGIFLIFIYLSRRGSFMSGPIIFGGGGGGGGGGFSGGGGGDSFSGGGGSFGGGGAGGGW